ncbi:MAG: hypothetical protein EPO06_07950 [Burkholderiaceae bacterium]|nr:MAG: hypothetical protein EPO06_07950 [Burkholderiaceae bacterium]
MCLLAACSPRFDWREIANSEAGYAALFPARPALVTRTLPHGAQTLTLTLQAAPVGQRYFAVGSAPLPATTEAALFWQSQLEAALLSNLDAQVTQAHAPQAPVLRDISASGTLRAQRGDAAGVPAKLRARFYLHHDRLYEVFVMAPAAEWDDEAVETFFTGFKLLDQQS